MVSSVADVTSQPDKVHDDVVDNDGGMDGWETVTAPKGKGKKGAKGGVENQAKNSANNQKSKKVHKPGERRDSDNHQNNKNAQKQHHTTPPTQEKPKETPQRKESVKNVNSEPVKVEPVETAKPSDKTATVDKTPVVKEETKPKVETKVNHKNFKICTEKKKLSRKYSTEKWSKLNLIKIRNFRLRRKLLLQSRLFPKSPKRSRNWKKRKNCLSRCQRKTESKRIPKSIRKKFPFSQPKTK